MSRRSGSPNSAVQHEVSLVPARPGQPPGDPLARQLQKVYVGLKRRWTGKASSPQAPSTVQWRCFGAAARRCRELQASGYLFEPAHFIWALFQRYGKRTYPQHFVASSSWTIFFEYMERRSTLIDTRVSFAAEFDQLSHLAASRGQSVRRAWRDVRASGLFTRAFVRRMDRDLRRRT